MRVSHWKSFDAIQPNSLSEWFQNVLFLTDKQTIMQFTIVSNWKKNNKTLQISIVQLAIQYIGAPYSQAFEFQTVNLLITKHILESLLERSPLKIRTSVGVLSFKKTF